MLFAELTHKFFVFLAHRLRRIAEFLTVEAPMEELRPGDENIAPKDFDWFERTSHIPPEQWLEFTSENDDMYSAEGAARKGTDPAGGEGAESVRFTSPKKGPKSDAEVKPKRLSRRKPVSEFLSVKEQKTEPVKLATEHADILSSVQRESASKKEFRLVPLLPDLNKEPRPERPEAPKQPSAADKPWGHEEAGKPSEPDPRRFTDDGLISRRAAHREMPVDILFVRKQGSRRPQSAARNLMHGNFDSRRSEPTEVDLGFEGRSKFIEKQSERPSIKGANVYPSDKLYRHSGRRNESTGQGWVFVGPPWVDLPDEEWDGAAAESEAIRSEAEHLNYLEREQAGND